jgi:hypothetical protein
MKLRRIVESIDGKCVLFLDDLLCSKMGIKDGSVLDLSLDEKVLTVVLQENRIDDAVFDRVFQQGMIGFRSILGDLV